MLQKSRMLQLQGVQGWSCSHLPQSLGNAEDAVSSAFPWGKQQNDLFAGCIFIIISEIDEAALISHKGSIS